MLMIPFVFSECVVFTKERADVKLVYLPNSSLKCPPLLRLLQIIYRLFTNGGGYRSHLIIRLIREFRYLLQFT